MASPIKGKVALVTGGLGAIGFSMVKELLKNDALGVAILDYSEEASHQVLNELENTYGRNKAIFIKTDVTNKRELEEAFEKTIESYKQLDIVVNNAGIINEVQWEKTVAVNLVAVIQGSYLAMERYLPKHRSGEEGVIVNIASILGLDTIQSVPIYCATKHGVVSLGQALGGEEYYRKYRVRVLTICPGVVNTPLVNDLLPQDVGFYEKSKEELDNLSKMAQDSDYVGKTLIKVLNEGKNGSLWVIEDEEPPYEVVIPGRKSLRKQT